jgi:hypothetical protein
MLIGNARLTPVFFRCALLRRLATADSDVPAVQNALSIGHVHQGELEFSSSCGRHSYRYRFKLMGLIVQLDCPAKKCSGRVSLRYGGRERALVSAARCA